MGEAIWAGLKRQMGFYGVAVHGTPDASGLPIE